jgi:hypothetical protein
MENQIQAGVILYVEDEASDLLLMQIAFRRLGLASRLQTAKNGQEAVDYLSATGDNAGSGQPPVPALVLLDINMPILSGFEVLAWVREQPRFSTLPIIMFSSSDRPADRQKAANLGANDYISKPSSGADFVGVIKDLYERWPTLGGPLPTGQP